MIFLKIVQRIPFRKTFRSLGINFGGTVGRAERRSAEAALSPCYLNTQFPADVALGVAVPFLGRNLSEAIRDALRRVPGVRVALADCLAPPAEEYEFPRDLYRYGSIEASGAGRD